MSITKMTAAVHDAATRRPRRSDPSQHLHGYQVAMKRTKKPPAPAAESAIPDIDIRAPKLTLLEIMEAFRQFAVAFPGMDVMVHVSKPYDKLEKRGTSILIPVVRAGKPVFGGDR